MPKEKKADFTPSPVFQTLNFNPRFNEAIQDPLYQILYFQHFKAPETNCYITLGKKTPNGNWFQRSFKPSEIKGGLQEFEGTNIYFSMNNFYVPFRQEKWIKELRALYVDLDFYKIEEIMNFSPEMILTRVDLEYVDEGLIPPPNGTIFSGNGLQLIWLIEPAIGINFKAKNLWIKLQKHFQETLSPLGADPQAIDISRMFRVAGTKNYKEDFGEKEVYFVHHHDTLYSMSLLADDYLPELVDKNKVIEEQFKQRTKTKNLNEKSNNYNGYSLNKARMKDLETLVTMRDGNFPNMRQNVVWLYRMFALQVTQSPKKALELAHQFNQTLKKPLPKEEVSWHTRSAEKKWLQEREKFGKDQMIRGYRLTNDRIIQILQITIDEQKQLKTIICSEEKKIRNAKSHEKYRRRMGIIRRDEYLKRTRGKNIESVSSVLERNPDATLAEISSETGLSITTIWRLKKKLNNYY